MTNRRNTPTPKLDVGGDSDTRLPLRDRTGGPVHGVQYDELANAFQLTRIGISVAVFIVCVPLAISWQWTGGYLIAGLAVAAALDAERRRRRQPRGSALVPILIDATAIGLAEILAQLPPSVFVAPLSYVVVSAFVLLGSRRALRLLPYPLVWVIAGISLAGTSDWMPGRLWLVSSAAILIYASGMVGVLTAAARALEQARFLSDQLRDSQARLQTAITGTSVILFQIDEDGIFTLSEGAGLEALGLRPGEVVGTSAFELYAEVPEVIESLERGLAGEDFRAELQVGEVFFEVHYTPLADEQGHVHGLNGMATDVTERRLALERLESLVQSKDEFVATIAHELRTPLTVVVGLAEEMRAGKQRFTEEEQQEFIKMIAEQSHEVAAIVDDLLVAARAEIGRLSVVPESIDLDFEIGGVAQECEHLRPADSTFEILNGDPVTAWADPRRFRQILRNLISNAYRYGGTNITVAFERQGAHTRLRVTDDGSGIAEQDKSTVFEPFRTAHSVPGKPGSMGLGLAVARQLATMMGGSLKYSRSDGHTIFELLLPAPTRSQGETAA